VAESQRFTRGSSLAWSVVWHLDGEAAAKAAEAKLAEQPFVEAFVAGLGGGTPAVDGRHAVVPGPPPIHLDLVPLRRGRLVSLLVVASSPEPFPELDATAARVRDRLA
jgi:hypothetical protein